MCKNQEETVMYVEMGKTQETKRSERVLITITSVMQQSRMDKH